MPQIAADAAYLEELARELSRGARDAEEQREELLAVRRELLASGAGAAPGWKKVEGDLAGVLGELDRAAAELAGLARRTRRHAAALRRGEEAEAVAGDLWRAVASVSTGIANGLVGVVEEVVNAPFGGVLAPGVGRALGETGLLRRVELPRFAPPYEDEGSLASYAIGVAVGQVAPAVVGPKVAGALPRVRPPSVGRPGPSLPAAGRTARQERLERLLEGNARRRLVEMDALNGAHGVPRHGAQTTLEQQFDRATTGLTPDGVLRPPVNASRFYSYRTQLAALQRAQTIYRRTRVPVVRIAWHEPVGHGFTGYGADLVETFNVRVFFANGKPYSNYPDLKPFK